LGKDEDVYENINGSPFPVVVHEHVCEHQKYPRGSEELEMLMTRKNEVKKKERRGGEGG
jgi:hypothetical protein